MHYTCYKTIAQVFFIYTFLLLHILIRSLIDTLMTRTLFLGLNDLPANIHILSKVTTYEFYQKTFKKPHIKLKTIKNLYFNIYYL